MQYPEYRERKARSAVLRIACFSLACSGLSACATLESNVEMPFVSLNQVEVERLALESQTVRLGFDVSNPNPFPLPVRRLRYGVKLDGHRFASGETGGSFTVPAQSDKAFTISVELDLLDTAPKLIHVLREGAYREIPYEVRGEFELDVPLSPPVQFANTGSIRLLR